MAKFSSSEIFGKLDVYGKTDLRGALKFDGVDLKGIATEAEAVAGIVTDKLMTPKTVKEAIMNISPEYNLPTASATVLGGIKVGSRLSISNGVLSATLQSDNNFTTTLKTKLEGIETGAQKNSSITKAEIEAKLTGVITSHSHTVTKSDVGLGSVENYAVATQAEAEAGTVNNKYVTPLRASQAITKLAPFVPLEVRTTDPTSPPVGRIWLRSDLV